MLPRPPLAPGFRIAGALLAVAGVVLGAARLHYGWKPGLLEFPLPVLCSTFTETRCLTTITRNAAGEVAILLLLSGLALAALACEPGEGRRCSEIRAKALAAAVAVDTVLVALASLTVFGLAFVPVLVVQMFATLALYHATFRWLLWRERRRPPVEATTPAAGKRQWSLP